MNQWILFAHIMCLFVMAGCSDVKDGNSSKSTPNSHHASEHGKCIKLAEFSDADGLVTDCSAESGKKVLLKLYVPEGSLAGEILQWLDTGEDSSFLGFTRKIHKLADKYQLNRWGFNFSGEKFASHFELSSNLISTDSGSSSITLDTPSSSSPAPEFAHYVQQGRNYAASDINNGKVRERQYSISFYSMSNNRLIIPKKNYKTLYHFSRDATDAEIIDLWNHIGSELIHPEKARSRLAVHTGASHGQTVSHFHFRLE